MKIRTVDQLLDKIGEERIWRIREIAALRAHCLKKDLPISTCRSLNRAFIPIAYAHWEGFVKKTSHYYLEYVAMQRLKLRELSPSFASLYLTKKCSQSISKGKPFSLVEVYENIINYSEQQVLLQYKDVVSTNSNLNSSTLRDICKSLGIEYREFEAKEPFIDFGLVGKRNHIAHGESQEINVDDIELVKEEVVTFIEIFRNKIENSALERRFLR